MSVTQLKTDRTLLFETDTAALDVAAATTTLTAAISVAITTPAAISTAAAVGPDTTYIKIGSEYLQVQSGGGTTAPTVLGGQLGSTAATHANGATVNLPGKLVVHLLTIAEVPNVDLIAAKMSSDINYVEITAGSGNTFPGGGSTLLLTDNDAKSTAHIQFPGSGTQLLVLASGGSQTGATGATGSAGPTATPPGNFTIGTVTAQWVPSNV